MTEEKPTVKVVVGIIRDEDRYIIAKRPEGDDVKYSGLWEFPGGRVNETTSHEEALKKHLESDFNIDVVVGDKIGTVTQELSDECVELTAFHVECISKKIKLSKHFAYRRVRLNMLKEFEMLPSTGPLTELLKQH
jgi:ADP-ribose pyrophosphatase YjhB (NUDIX family)